VQDFLTFFGHGFCHQLHSRTFMVGDLYFSACARDTGIYLGLAFAVLVAFLIYAKQAQKPAEMPPVWVIVCCGVLMVPLIIDGATSYLGLRATTNAIRYVTGLLCGMGVGTLVVPLLFELGRGAQMDRAAFSAPLTYALFLAGTLFLGALFYFGYPLLGTVAPFVPIAAFVAIVTTVNLLLLSLSRRLRPTGSRRRWVLVLVVALALALVEITLMGALRDVIFHALLGDIPLDAIFR